MGAYNVVAKNFSTANENKIHSDEIARKYGFKGALVPGVAVFGHMTHPLVERFGEDWLRHSLSNVRFHKPAYHEDALRIEVSEDAEGVQVQCHNAEDVLLADLRTSLPTELPELHDSAVFDEPAKDPIRVDMTWDTVQPMQPFNDWHFQITTDGNNTHAEQIADALPIYRHIAHPHWQLSIANKALSHEYIMPAWLHVGSEIRFRELVRVGDTLRVKAVPLEKWQRKGHEFIRLYVAYLRDDVLTTEIFHTAIFKVAE